jgi:hypothetical protein
MPIAMVTSGTAEAYFVDGNDLHRVCGDGGQNNQTCLGYVLGIVDGALSV